MGNYINIYNSLEGIDVYILWGVGFIFLFLFILSLVLIHKNKQLRKLIFEERINKKEESSTLVKQQNIINENEENLKQEEIKINDVSKKTIAEEDKKAIVKDSLNPNLTTNNNIKNETKNKIEVQKPNNLYQKNILKELNANRQTSPISIEPKHEKEKQDLIEGLSEVGDNTSYLENVKSKLEKEITPDTIELTDYEQKQEDEAIISYKELLEVKDKLYNITEDEEDIDFIEELKSFRHDL